MAGLGTLSGAKRPFSFASAGSVDVQVIVGWSTNANNHNDAFR